VFGLKLGVTPPLLVSPTDTPIFSFFGDSDRPVFFFSVTILRRVPDPPPPPLLSNYVISPFLPFLISEREGPHGHPFTFSHPPSLPFPPIAGLFFSPKDLLPGQPCTFFFALNIGVQIPPFAVDFFCFTQPPPPPASQHRGLSPIFAKENPGFFFAAKIPPPPVDPRSLRRLFFPAKRTLSQKPSLIGGFSLRPSPLFPEAKIAFIFLFPPDYEDFCPSTDSPF